MKHTPVYGMMAEFDSAQSLVDAAHHTHEAGYMKIDAYSPFPVEGLGGGNGISQEPRAAGCADRWIDRRFVRLRCCSTGFRR